MSLQYNPNDDELRPAKNNNHMKEKGEQGKNHDYDLMK